MKGIVFNLLEEVVQKELGEDTWDALLEAAGLDGSFTSVGSYSDQNMLRLVEAASSALKKPPGDILRWFGRRSMPLLAGRYPKFFEGHSGTHAFLLTLNDVIHPEVRKLYPGATVPMFDFDTSAPGVLLMGYASTRKLCALAEGFIEGAADHYKEEVAVEQPSCMLRGNDRCLLRVSLRPSKS